MSDSAEELGLPAIAPYDPVKWIWAIQDYVAGTACRSSSTISMSEVKTMGHITRFASETFWLIAEMGDDPIGDNTTLRTLISQGVRLANSHADRPLAFCMTSGVTSSHSAHQQLALHVPHLDDVIIRPNEWSQRELTDVIIGALDAVTEGLGSMIETDEIANTHIAKRLYVYSMAERYAQASA